MRIRHYLIYPSSYASERVDRRAFRSAPPLTAHRSSDPPPFHPHPHPAPLPYTLCAICTSVYNGYVRAYICRHALAHARVHRLGIREFQLLRPGCALSRALNLISGPFSHSRACTLRTRELAHLATLASILPVPRRVCFRLHTALCRVARVAPFPPTPPPLLTLLTLSLHPRRPLLSSCRGNRYLPHCSRRPEITRRKSLCVCVCVCVCVRVQGDQRKPLGS